MPSPCRTVGAPGRLGVVGFYRSDINADRVFLDAGAADLLVGDARLAERGLTLKDALVRVHDDDREQLIQSALRARRDGGAFFASFRVLGNDGERRILNQGWVLRSQDGACGCGSYYDVTGLDAVPDIEHGLPSLLHGRNDPDLRRGGRPLPRRPRGARTPWGIRICACLWRCCSWKSVAPWSDTTDCIERAQANFKSLIASKSCTPPPTRLVV